MKKIFSKILMLSLAMTLVLSGCSKTQETGENSTGETSSAPSNPVFTYAIDGENGNVLNPMTASDRYSLMACHLAYSPPYFIYPDGSVEYIIAESMTASEDGLSYTMVIKEGLKWSDGTPITVDDIIFSYEKRNEQSKNLFVDGKPITLEKVDDKTVLFKLPSVSVSAFEVLGAEISIVPKHIFETKGNFDINMLEEKVVGYGPYTLAEYQTGQYFKFEKYADYKNAEPSIQTIVLKIVEKSDTASLALQNGEVDALIATPDMTSPFENENFKINNYSEGRVAYLKLNSASENMKDKAYREGILYALNRADIMKAAYTDESFYKLSYSFLPPANEFYTEDVQKWEQDVTKAKELVANGSKNLKLCYIASNKPQENMALTIQKELADIGITVELAGVTDEAYMTVAYDKNSGEYDMFLGGYVMGVDPHSFTALFVSTTDNWVNYNNKDVDELFAKGNAELDKTKRAEIYKELQMKVSEEALFYPFGSNMRTLVTSARVDGIEDAKLVPIYTFGEWGKLKLK